jgi:ABC-2 type transport system permease protein
MSVAGPAGGSREGGYTTAMVVRSEWTKFKSVRSTLWALGTTAVLALAIGMLATGTVASRWDRLSVSDRLAFDPTRRSLTGLLLAQLAIGVLGVLVVSSEYSSGLIRSTLAAVPRRPPVLAAKAAVFAAVAIVVSVAVSFAAFLVGQAILSGSPAPHAALGDPGVLRAVVCGGIYLALLGLIALGFAAIVRHTAGSIAAFVGILLVLPLIVTALPESISDAVGRYLPADIGAQMMSVHHHANQLGPWAGFGILCGYAAAVLVTGGWLMSRRDA